MYEFYAILLCYQRVSCILGPSEIDKQFILNKNPEIGKHRHEMGNYCRCCLIKMFDRIKKQQKRIMEGTWIEEIYLLLEKIPPGV